MCRAGKYACGAYTQLVAAVFLSKLVTTSPSCHSPKLPHITHTHTHTRTLHVATEQFSKTNNKHLCNVCGGPPALCCRHHTHTLILRLYEQTDNLMMICQRLWLTFIRACVQHHTHTHHASQRTYLATYAPPHHYYSINTSSTTISTSSTRHARARVIRVRYLAERRARAQPQRDKNLYFPKGTNERVARSSGGGGGTSTKCTQLHTRTRTHADTSPHCLSTCPNNREP